MVSLWFSCFPVFNLGRIKFFPNIWESLWDNRVTETLIVRLSFPFASCHFQFFFQSWSSKATITARWNGGPGHEHAHQTGIRDYSFNIVGTEQSTAVTRKGNYVQYNFPLELQWEIHGALVAQLRIIKRSGVEHGHFCLCKPQGVRQ